MTSGIQNPISVPSDYASSEPTPPAPPPIPYVNPKTLPKAVLPTKRVHEPSDLPKLFDSAGLNRVIAVLLNMSHMVARFGLLDTQDKVDSLHGSLSFEIKKIVKIFDQLDEWITEIPLDQDRQRFGNKAFKVWGHRLEMEAERLHEDLMDKDHQVIKSELLFHFKSSFGSFVRLDYGTGHELSFMAYLSILHLTRVLSQQDLLASVLVVYQRYLDIARRLQEVYRLEPAGSKGVYGLDDHFHLVYIFGSAQLLYHPTIVPGQMLERSFLSTANLDRASLFFSAILHINALKRGPFHEHSPILYNVGLTVKSWQKVHSGMMKMWRGEVLSKVQVMQHFWLTGPEGVLCWDQIDDDQLGESFEEGGQT